MKTKNNKKRISLLIGLGIIALLIISYFIPITTDKGLNYIINDSLLGIIIFHNPFVLGLYILIGVIFIWRGIIYK